jgi:hypothetical protein
LLIFRHRGNWTRQIEDFTDQVSSTSPSANATEPSSSTGTTGSLCERIGNALSMEPVPARLAAMTVARWSG